MNTPTMARSGAGTEDAASLDILAFFTKYWKGEEEGEEQETASNPIFIIHNENS